MTHPASEQLQRYHDGELPADQRQTIQAHLAQCGACSRYVAQLDGLSQLLQSVELPAFGDGARRRMLSVVAASRTDLGLRHFAEWFVGVAAVLVVGLMILPAKKSAIVQRIDSTESVDVGYIDTVAVMPPTTHAGSNRQLVQFAQWMAGDVAAGATR